MVPSRRRRTLLLWCAAITMLVTILWSAYQFTAMWLLQRCAKELAYHAKSPPEFKLPVPQGGDTILLESGSDVLAQAVVAIQEARTSERIVDRLQALQRPSFRVVWIELLSRSNEGAESSSTVFAKPSPPPGPFLSSIVSIRNVPPDVNLSAQTSCFAVRTTAGELVSMVVTRPSVHSGNQSTQSELGEHRPAVLLVDSSGRIFAQVPCPEDSFLGKLVDPLSKADKLIFSSGEIHWHRMGGNELIMSTGSATVCVIENDQLKTVQQFWLRSLPSDVVQAPSIARDN